MSLLSEALRRFGVGKYEELNEEEKKTYREWEAALAGRQLTEKEVRAFLDREIEESVATLIGKQLSERDDTFLKMKIDFIRKLCTFLDSPKQEQRATEQLLKQQLSI